VKPPIQFPEVNIGDLMEVICNHRQEAYKFERHIALRTFSAWVLWPNQLGVVSQAKIVSAALTIRMVRSDESITGRERAGVIAAIMKNAVQPELLSDVLINPPLVGRFCQAAEKAYGLLDVGQILRFMLSCPKDLRPSLNKAIHFIELSGFGLPHSPAVLKQCWVQYAVSAPFMFAEDFWSGCSIDLTPDDERHNAKAMRLLSDVNGLRRYFGVARYIQEVLLQRLDEISRKRFRFVQFPASIKASPIEFGSLSPDQLNIVKSYKAPKPRLAVD
jgi:hypothetical protein